MEPDSEGGPGGDGPLAGRDWGCWKGRVEENDEYEVMIRRSCLLYCTLLYCNALNCTVLYCIALYTTVLNCAVQFYTMDVVYTLIIITVTETMNLSIFFRLIQRIHIT